MATGQLPFGGESAGVIFHDILEREPINPVRLNPDLPAKLEDIINRALEKDRELRYQGAAEMRSELKRLKRDADSGRSGSSPIAVSDSGSAAVGGLGSAFHQSALQVVVSSAPHSPSS